MLCTEKLSADVTVIESYNAFRIYPIRHCHKRFVELYLFGFSSIWLLLLYWDITLFSTI